MRITGPITNIYVLARPLYHRRVENLHAVNDLGNKPAETLQAVMLNQPGVEKPLLSRFETGYRGKTFETGIPAGFVAHLLGQISETNRADPRLVARAYQATGTGEEGRFLRSI